MYVILKYIYFGFEKLERLSFCWFLWAMYLTAGFIFTCITKNNVYCLVFHWNTETGSKEEVDNLPLILCEKGKKEKTLWVSERELMTIVGKIRGDKK